MNGQISNTGTIECDSGTLYLDANSITQISGSSLTAGTWNAMNGAILEFPSGTDITNNEATVAMSGSGGGIEGLQGLADNSGSLSFTNGASFTTAGDFTNSGTLTLNDFTETIAGNFTQASTGTLIIGIEGSPISGDFGQADVSGSASLAGTFTLDVVNGFTAVAGESYQLFSFTSSSGNFTTLSGFGSTFTETINPTSLVVSTFAIPIDLEVASVTAPMAPVVSGSSITVGWQVDNLSDNATTLSWQDSVYLSTTDSITASSILLGNVAHSGDDAGIAADGNYDASFTTNLPGVAPGSYYVLVVTDSLYQVPDPNRANNTLAASNQLVVTVPTLTLNGSAYPDSFTAPGQSKYYQVPVPAGGSLTFTLQSDAASGGLAMYVSVGTPPTPYSYQESGKLSNQPNQTVTVPQVFARQRIMCWSRACPAPRLRPGTR